LISFVAFLSSFEAIQLSQILLSEYGYSNNSVLIDLSSKNIESIDVNTFIGFTNLQVLYLNKNKLSRLNEPVFKNISNLKEISKIEINLKI
jgi:Leucine-rich repeat (LRR) protein